MKVAKNSQKDKKFHVGIGEIIPLIFNPTREELDNILGIERDEDYEAKPEFEYFKENVELKQKDKDKLIARSLRNAAITYCEYEKSKKIGYDMSDLYYYNPSVVEAFLPSIISESYEIPTKIQDLNFKFGKGDATDGNNWLSLRSDIATAYYKLTEAKQNVLRLRFSIDSPDWSLLAYDMQSTPDGARMKVQRAISSLIKNLGGWRPQSNEDVNG